MAPRKRVNFRGGRLDDRGHYHWRDSPPRAGVAAWVKGLQQTHGAPGVKQQLAAVRMLFDWLITGQIVPITRR